MDNKKIGCFGDEYSHTYRAAREIFADRELNGFNSITKTLSAVADRELVCAVVPLENSLEGTVNESLDAIAAMNLYIIKEHISQIHHSLIVKAGAKKEDIITVYSHPQALAQCRKFLEKNFPLAKIIPVSYTSEGLNHVTDNTSAAVAHGGNFDGYETLFKQIEDGNNNVTRFAVVSGAPKLAGNKASVMLTTLDEPGALIGILTTLYKKGINMTKLESRPNREKLGGYNFFIDFNFGDTENLGDILAALENNCRSLKFLGSY